MTWHPKERLSLNSARGRLGVFFINPLKGDNADNYPATSLSETTSPEAISI